MHTKKFTAAIPWLLAPVLWAAEQGGRLRVDNGWLMHGDRPVWGWVQHNGWWRAGQRANITRRSVGDPQGDVRPNRTEDLDKLTDAMLRFGYPGFEHNFGLWYDRRRDAHDAAPRQDAKALPPFLEQPWARSKEGRAADGLPRYDLTRFNPWYFQRLAEFARLCDAKGTVLLHKYAMQHALLERQAHYVDFPWREANCVQTTGMPDHIPAANAFYDVAHPQRRALHRAYIRKCLDTLGPHRNVIHMIGQEYTGPREFAEFWLDTIAEWQEESGTKVHVALGACKDVQDAILADPRRRAMVDVLDLRYWWRRANGTLAAIPGGRQLPGRGMESGKRQAHESSLLQIYRKTREVRERFPGKALIDALGQSRRQSWAFLMGGGSLLVAGQIEYPGKKDPLDYIQPANTDLVLPTYRFVRESLAPVFMDLRPADLERSRPDDNWCLAAPGHAYLVYASRGGALTLDLTADSATYEARWFDPRSGELRNAGPVTGGAARTVQAPDTQDWALWLQASNRKALPPEAKTPLPGQIVIDPEHPQWLKRAGGGHVFICGPGDPENFLHRGLRRADGTRDGDQQALLDKLVEHGGNCIYMQMIRSHGGDGKRDHNPFRNSDPALGLDPAILDQWDTWFAHMDRHGILVYLFLYDDSTRVWGKRGSGIGPAEEAFVRAVVTRFCGLRNLIWIVAEEAEEAYTHDESQRLGAIIRDADPHAHVVGNHHRSSTTFFSWREGGSLDHFSMQFNAAGDAAHGASTTALRKAQGRYQVIYSESTAARPDLRHAWACAMGGLMPMMLKMDIAGTPPEQLRQCRYLQRFFEDSDFYRMAPHDELAHAGTRWVLADPGCSYIAYSPKDAGALGLRQLPAATWQLRWLDCRTGRRVADTHGVTQTGDVRLPRPAGIGPWAAVWVRRANFPARAWPRRSPAEAGFDPAGLAAFTRAVGGDGVVVRDGCLVAAWGRPDRRGDWASAAKPVMSTLLLFMVHEGRLASLDARVAPWVEKALPGKKLLTKDVSMTFRHLANMTSGYARAEAPGVAWAYNDYGIALYRALLGNVLGASFDDATCERLAALQFQDGGIFGSRGGGGVNASPRDFARIGWFWLRQGAWGGQTLLPKALFAAHCRPQVPTDLPRTKAAGKDYLRVGTSGGGSDQSYLGAGRYGCNWWFNAETASGKRWAPHLPADAFYAMGHTGKEVLLVVPSLDLVVAARGDWGGVCLHKTAGLIEACAASR